MADKGNLIGKILDHMGSNQQIQGKYAHDKQMKTMDAVLMNNARDDANMYKIEMENQTTQRLKDQQDHQANIQKIMNDSKLAQDKINKEWQLQFEELKQTKKAEYDNSMLIKEALLPYQMQQQMAPLPDPNFVYDDIAVSIGSGERETGGFLNPLMDSDMTDYLRGGLQGMQQQMKELRKLPSGSPDKESAIARLVDMYNQGNKDSYANDDIFSNDETEKELLMRITSLLKSLGYDTKNDLTPMVGSDEGKVENQKKKPPVNYGEYPLR